MAPNSNSNRDNAMTTVFPRGALAAFLLTWGFLSDHQAISIALSGLIEGVKLQNLRWDLNSKHFQNIADVTTVLFAVVAVYQFVQYGFHGIYGILGLLPLILFPLVFAQRSSSAELFPMSALFLSLRKKIARGITQEQWVSTELIFALSCLLAASTGESSGNVYFLSLLLCATLMLYLLRPKRTRFYVWLLAIILVAGLAVLVRTGMEIGYRQVESTMSYWFSQFKWGNVDPNRARTAIGHIGRLKLSDRIVLRVKAPLSIPLPLYIHEATYTNFNLGSWHGIEQEPIAIDRIANSMQYPLVPELSESEFATDYHRIEITAKHPKDVSVQGFPIGSTSVESDEIIELKKNPLGTISLEAIPGQLRYQVDYRPGDASAIDALRGQPAQTDLAVPEGYINAFEKIAQDLELNALPRDVAIAQVHKFFRENFSYTLIGKGYYPGRKPLLHFINEQRSGHCEYFATATTLLLRTAGIPARYSVGYVVDEYSSLERAFIARARHAHAWTEAFVDGHWQVIDTTPPNWLSLEEERVSQWQTIQDYLGWAGMHINRLQRLDRSNFNQRIIWIVPILLVLLMWRLRRKITVKDPPVDNKRIPYLNATNADIARFIEILKQQGMVPDDGQTVQNLLTEHCPKDLPYPNVKRLVSLYNKERFSMSPLGEGEKLELAKSIDAYITGLHSQDKSQLG